MILAALAVAASAASFTGLWDTSYGPMRVSDQGTAAAGRYAHGAGGSLLGSVEKGKWTFKYKEPKGAGEGWFQLSKDGKSFAGKWRPEGRTTWEDWKGTLVAPVPGRKWLVVVEARWEEKLSEREYSYGEMLKAFFARDKNVEVRHRFFNEPEGMKRWLREAVYLPEPVYVYVSSHGEKEGIEPGDGSTVPLQELAAELASADNIKLLHFGSCMVMKGQIPPSRFPISGYTTYIDWNDSAISDFLYLDLMLSRDFSPEDAASQLPAKFPWSKEAGFRFQRPKA